MHYIFKKYWLVIKFILSFVLVYSVLTIGYKLYLDYSDGSIHYPDYFTNLVGRQSQQILIALDYPTVLEAHPNEPSLKVIIKGKYLFRILEGCNSISILILFLAFVIPFSDTFKKTSLFILAGSVLIYCTNLFRIVFLCIGLYKYPWRHDIFHAVIFPLVIYGMVFLLWMFWIQHFTKQQKQLEPSV